jgi:hypothetical protein
VRDIEERLATSLPPTLLFEHGTIAELADHLTATYDDKHIEPAAPIASAPVAGPSQGGPKDAGRHQLLIMLDGAGSASTAVVEREEYRFYLRSKLPHASVIRLKSKATDTRQRCTDFLAQLDDSIANASSGSTPFRSAHLVTSCDVETSLDREVRNRFATLCDRVSLPHRHIEVPVQESAVELVRRLADALHTDKL